MNKKNTVVFLIICSALGVSLSWYGFTLGYMNFLPNLVAGWAQFFIQIVLGLLFFDNIVDGVKSRQWDKVKEIHYRILSEHVVKLFSEVALRLNYIDIAKSLLYKKKTNRNISAIMENLIREINFLDAQDTSEHKQVFLDYFNDMKEEIKEIRAIFIPQILSNINDMELANLLSELDLLLIKFEDDIVRCRAKEKAYPNMINFIRLIECATSVYNKLIVC